MNPNAKHTHSAGPWTAHKYQTITGGNAFQIRGTPHGVSIANLSPGSTTDRIESVAEANARLIAASPALLSALHACLGDLVDIVRAEGGDESEAMRQARAAIAQAEGGAQ